MGKVTLSIKDGSFKPDGEAILENINLTIPKGKFIRVTGTSGAGKSTLLKLFAGLVPLHTGQLIFNDKNFSDWKPSAYRKEVSYVAQTPRLFGQTIYDNLAFPAEIRDEKFDEKKAQQLLEAFQLANLKLSDPISRLSGGERQRVGLIQHLMYEPKVLLLDEITSALDRELRIVIWNWLITHAKEHEQTVLWISHIQDEVITPDYEMHIHDKKIFWEEK